MQACNRASAQASVRVSACVRACMRRAGMHGQKRLMSKPNMSKLTEMCPGMCKGMRTSSRPASGHANTRTCSRQGHTRLCRHECRRGMRCRHAYCTLLCGMSDGGGSATLSIWSAISAVMPWCQNYLARRAEALPSACRIARPDFAERVSATACPHPWALPWRIGQPLRGRHGAPTWSAGWGQH